MSSELDEMRAMVREGFARYGRESYAFEQRKRFLPQGGSETAWKDYAELGWLALRLPEEHGGLNADAAMSGALMETVGAELLLEPLWASAVVGTGALLRADDPALLAGVAPKLADGSCRLALAHDGEAGRYVQGAYRGRKIGVLHGDVADQLIVTARDAAGGEVLLLIDAAASGVTRKAYRLVDGRGAAIVVFDDAPARVIGDAVKMEHVLDEAAVALCAEALGCADRLVPATAAYLKVRKQFGKPIGSYQALQHRMSEMHLLREEIRALTAAAQRALEQPAAARARVVSGAAAYTITAARRIGNDAVQLHGGVGVTDELDISHHFRRIMVITALLGGRDRHIERFAHSPAPAHGAGAAA